MKKAKQSLPRWVWGLIVGGVIILGIAVFVVIQSPKGNPFLPANTPPPAGYVMVSPRDGMKLHYVPAGPFTMGSDAYADEQPVHTVTLDAFWIDESEVTNQMYSVCVADGKCMAPLPTKDVTYYDDPKFVDYPVINVRWDDAVTYCQWAGRKLPSEAQWEKAARGPNGNEFPWGNDPPSKTLVNYNNVVNGGSTSKAGEYPNGKSFYGAYDMAGNVFEWVSDWYNDTYYASSPSYNPPGPDSGFLRGVRGGSWDNDEYFIRSATRSGARPYTWIPDIGFRCVLPAQ